jgi:asparagine synthase (glutamine-hydrolysing)
VLHFAGAVSRWHDRRLPESQRALLRRAFSERMLGTVEAFEDARGLVLLERRDVPLPPDFRHFTVAVSPGWKLMISGLVHDCPTATDPASLAAAIRPFTPAAIGRLAGDHSLVAWQTETDRVILSSSFMGVQPLFYLETEAAVVWSSSLAVVRAMTPSREIDRSFLASFLVLERSVDRTPYRAIRNVRPGWVLSIDGSAPGTLQQAATITDEDLVLRDEREYAERLGVLVERAVADRMPSHGVCHAELSGGLDSSTVTLLASRVARRTGVSLRTIHYTSTASPEWDETRFARAVATAAGVESDVVDLDDLNYLYVPDDVGPDVPTAAQRAAARLVRMHGGEVLLSGRVGDAVFGNTRDNSLSASEHLGAGRYGLFASRLLEWSIATEKPAIALIGAMIVAHLAPGWSERRGRRRRSHGARTDNGRVVDHSLLPPVLAEARARSAEFIGLATKLVRPSKRRLLDTLLAYSVSHALQNRIDGILVLCPFVDRRVLMYLLSVPPELHSMPSQPRYLMRQAFSDLWPPAIRRRFSKGYAMPASLRLFQPYARSLYEQRQYMLADVGMLDVGSLRGRLAQYLSGGAPTVGNLNRIWYAEEWLRRLNGMSSLIPDRARGGYEALPPQRIQQREEVKPHAL